MGEWDILSLKEPIPFAEISVANIFIHPNFDNKTNKNNIAIVRLTQKFNLGEVPTITTGCLPCAHEKNSLLFSLLISFHS